MLDLDPANLKQASTKSLVFRSLSRKFPSSIAEITAIIGDEYKVKAGYQTVRKAVNSLLSDGILKREGTAYVINRSWLIKTKGVVDSLLLRYEVGGGINSAEEYSVFIANSLYEADNLWCKLLVDLAENALAMGEKFISSFWHYAWWLLINFGQETNLFAELKQKGHKITQHVYRDLPLNRWGINVYREIGVEMRLADTNTSSDLHAFNIVGQSVLQVTFPEKIIRKVREVFDKYSDVQSIPPQVIRNLVHARCLVQFAIIRNGVVAESIITTQGLPKGNIVKRVL